MLKKHRTYFTRKGKKNPMNNSELAGIHEEIDLFVDDLAFFSKHLASQGILPGNAGDVSYLLSPEAAEAVVTRFGQPDRLFPFSALSEFVDTRNDGRDYYNAESIPAELIQEHIKPIAGRYLILTVTGAKLWDVERNPDRQLCILQVDSNGRGVYQVYGNNQHGTIPSIETPSHLLANAVNVENGLTTSSAFHCHPTMLVALSAHASIKGSFAEFNRVLYSQKEGLLTNMPELIGMVKYHPSGSRALFEQSTTSLRQHRLTLWQHHGVFVRERSLERCVDLLGYAEDAASAGLRATLTPQSFEGLTVADLEIAIRIYDLQSDILNLFDNP